MSVFWFNVKDGYTEALCRGFRSGFLTAEDYRRLGMSETLEDLRSALEDTDYGSFLQDEPTPLAATTFQIKCREKLSKEFLHLRAMANQPLVQFLDFIAADKMIDNVIGLIRGSINKKPTEELLLRLDPLGSFPEIRAIAAMDLTTGYEELYRTLLIDTPVAPYFEKFLNSTATAEHGQAKGMSDVASIFSETDLEVMRSILKKAWLEDFYDFCITQGGTTADVMGHILNTEADYRVLTVTLNSIHATGGEGAPAQDRSHLYPSFGYLYPEGTDKIRKAYNDTTMRSSLESFQSYLNLYEQCRGYYFQEDGAGQGGTKSLEDYLYAEEVKMCEMAFEQQMHYGVFYAWVRLKEQEIRNIVWIADMVLMKRPEATEEILPIFGPR